jgi:hypothetical protein
MALAAGARLGSYEVLSALGSGGMGEVYRAPPDLFVQPFPATGEKRQIGVGRYPVCSRDEKRLYYCADVGTEFGVVGYADQPTFKVVGKPLGWPRSGAVLAPVAPRNYDLAPNGKHFLIVVEAGGTADAPTQVGKSRLSPNGSRS